MTIIVSTEGAVATVTLDRPDKKNAMNREMRVAMREVFERLQDDTAIRAIVLTGAGADFCAGADIREMGGGGIADAMGRMELQNRTMRALIHTGVPVVAAVRGVCIGVAWSIALACDYIVAAPDARFQFGFRNVGLAPDGGAIHLLSRNLGPVRARALVYSGRFVGGEEAHALGLVSELAPAADVLARAQALAAEWATAPTLSLRAAKLQFAAAENQTIEEALAAERVMQPLLVRSDDFHEGAAAFKEKRKPSFTGQ